MHLVVPLGLLERGHLLLEEVNAIILVLENLHVMALLVVHAGLEVAHVLVEVIVGAASDLQILLKLGNAGASSMQISHKSDRILPREAVANENVWQFERSRYERESRKVAESG